MGTNYYTEDGTHIGKRSGAFRFMWDFQNMKSVEEFLSFLHGKRIFDEYKQEYELSEFLNMAHNWNKEDGRVVEGYKIFTKNNIVWSVSKYTNFE